MYAFAGEVGLVVRVACFGAGAAVVCAAQGQHAAARATCFAPIVCLVLKIDP